MKIKLFDDISRSALEREVNEFIELHGIDAADIQYNTYINGHGVDIWTVMIVYE